MLQLGPFSVKNRSTWKDHAHNSPWKPAVLGAGSSPQPHTRGLVERECLMYPPTWIHIRTKWTTQGHTATREAKRTGPGLSNGNTAQHTTSQDKKHTAPNDKDKHAKTLQWQHRPAYNITRQKKHSTKWQRQACEEWRLLWPNYNALQEWQMGTLERVNYDWEMGIPK